MFNFVEIAINNNNVYKFQYYLEEVFALLACIFASISTQYSSSSFDCNCNEPKSNANCFSTSLEHVERRKSICLFSSLTFTSSLMKVLLFLFKFINYKSRSSQPNFLGIFHCEENQKFTFQFQKFLLITKELQTKQSKPKN